MIAAVPEPAGVIAEPASDIGSMQRQALHLHLRSSLQVARILLEEVLDGRHAAEDPEAHAQLVGKAGGEVAMLLRLALRSSDVTEDRTLIHQLANNLAPAVRTPRVRRCLVLRPSRAPMHAMAHLCLQSLGDRDDAFDSLVRQALMSGTAAANERVPYRLLDSAWTRHLAFGDIELQHPALALSPLGVGIDLVASTVEDAYAFTHALPYATDFGRLPLPEAFNTADLMDLADAVAVQALADDDLDLLAEVLMAPAALRQPWTPVLVFGWQLLDRVWSENGFVPGPGLPPPVTGENRTQTVRRVLGTAYHTTLAAGMTCATMLFANACPPASTQGQVGEIPSPAVGGQAWREQWRCCTQAQQDELGFLLLSLELRQALTEVNLSIVHRLVHRAAEQGWLDKPLVLQATEMLSRAVA